MADIFLSYSSQDRERLRPLDSMLEQHGWSVWWDRKIPLGKTYDQIIEQALDEARCVVVVWSQNSVQSDWVKVEADEGLNRRILVPVLIEEARIPLAFRRLQAARLVDWQGEASHHELAMLFESVTAIVGEGKQKEKPAPEESRIPVHKESKRNLKPWQAIGGAVALIALVIVGIWSARIGRDSGPVEPKPLAGGSPASLPATSPQFEYKVATTDERGKVIHQETKSLQYFIEEINGVKLEMVEISGGPFTMGTAESEIAALTREWTRLGLAETDADVWNKWEMPKHQVNVQPFQMGKNEVTQAQWRVVAGLPEVKVDLKPDPSNFKGDDLPVESISWDEAVEFCARLSRKTGGNYRLPSETEWEYAARAGTRTPFHFGPTITPDLVNYDGGCPYGNAPKGAYRQKTTRVGSFGVANGFGLFDMHGNVWEWCEDDFHGDYNGAPNDGSAWIDNPRGSGRVIRGGGWNSIAVVCRSAYRGHARPGGRDVNLGFRLVRIGP